MQLLQTLCCDALQYQTDPSLVGVVFCPVATYCLDQDAAFIASSGRHGIVRTPAYMLLCSVCHDAVFWCVGLEETELCSVSACQAEGTGPPSFINSKSQA